MKNDDGFCKINELKAPLEEMIYNFIGKSVDITILTRENQLTNRCLSARAHKDQSKSR